MDVHALVNALSGLDPRLSVYVLSLLPLVEPRYAVVIGVTVYGLKAWEALTVSLLGLATLSVLLTLFLESLMESALHGVLSRITVLYKLASWVQSRSLARASKYREYGLLGVLVFVAIPLPLTGVYSGSVLGLVLGLNKKELFMSLFVGGLLSLGITLLGVSVTRLP
ncbi:MAG: small multi-drug export protein [Desulfurococcales archaeon]|nr:small multi-drug export protein [Desulfurococcales archaeon]